MKKINWLALIFTILNTISAAHATIYAQLISNQTLFIDHSTINKATSIPVQPVAGIISGINWDEKKNIITIQEDGIYAIVSNVQYGFRKSDNAKGGDFYYWLESNGDPLKNSSNSVHIDPLTKSNLTEFSYILPLKKGSQLRFMFSSNRADIGIISYSGTNIHPNSPSLTVSIFKVGNIVTYM